MRFIKCMKFYDIAWLSPMASFDEHGELQSVLQKSFLTTLSQIGDWVRAGRLANMRHMEYAGMIPTWFSNVPKRLEVFVDLFYNANHCFSANSVHQPPSTYATWLSGTPNLTALRIIDTDWSGQNFKSLNTAYPSFGPELRTLIMGTSHRSLEAENQSYLDWTYATTCMIKRDPNLTRLSLFGPCYHAGIICHVPKSLQSLALVYMVFGGGQVESTHFNQLREALYSLPYLKYITIKHDYESLDGIVGEIFHEVAFRRLKEEHDLQQVLLNRGAEKVAISNWNYEEPLRWDQEIPEAAIAMDIFYY